MSEKGNKIGKSDKRKTTAKSQREEAERTRMAKMLQKAYEKKAQGKGPATTAKKVKPNIVDVSESIEKAYQEEPVTVEEDVNSQVDKENNPSDSVEKLGQYSKYDETRFVKAKSELQKAADRYFRKPNTDAHLDFDESNYSYSEISTSSSMRDSVPSELQNSNKRVEIAGKMKELLSMGFSLFILADIFEKQDFNKLDEVLDERKQLFNEFIKYKDEIGMFGSFKAKVGDAASSLYVRQKNQMKTLIESLKLNVFNEKVTYEDAVSSVIDSPEFGKACEIEIGFISGEIDRAIEILEQMQKREELRKLVESMRSLQSTILNRKEAFDMIQQLAESAKRNAEKRMEEKRRREEYRYEKRQDSEAQTNPTDEYEVFD